jgi:hypothetical protein
LQAEHLRRRVLNALSQLADSYLARGAFGAALPHA